MFWAARAPVDARGSASGGSTLLSQCSTLKIPEQLGDAPRCGRDAIAGGNLAAAVGSRPLREQACDVWVREGDEVDVAAVLAGGAEHPSHASKLAELVSECGTLSAPAVCTRLSSALVGERNTAAIGAVVTAHKIATAPSSPGRARSTGTSLMRACSSRSVATSSNRATSDGSATTNI